MEYGTVRILHSGNYFCPLCQSQMMVRIFRKSVNWFGNVTCFKRDCEMYRFTYEVEIETVEGSFVEVNKDHVIDYPQR